jgi:hypothetical protein
VKTRSWILAAATIAAACSSDRSSRMDDGDMRHERGRASEASASTRPGGGTGRARDDMHAAILAEWPQKTREAAQKIVDRYGPPDEATRSMLVWRDNGPWKRTIAYREEVRHEFPMAHVDSVEQVIDYRVPPDKFDELAQYDGSVICERTKGEMSARCDMEPLNFLAINLAHEVITGERTVEDARAFYARTAMAFKEGRKDRYTQGLLEGMPTGRSADPDSPARP